MKLLEISAELAAAYCNITPDDVGGMALLEDVMMPAAMARLESYTGHTRSELNAFEEVSVAFLALCSFLYDNRSAVVENDKANEVLDGFLAAHRVNLVPSEESGES